MNRRGLLLGLGASLVTAPAIVRAGSLMPVKVVDWGGSAAEFDIGYNVSYVHFGPGKYTIPRTLVGRVGGWEALDKFLAANRAATGHVMVRLRPGSDWIALDASTVNAQ